MMWQNNTYAIPVLLFAIPLTSFAIVAWRRRPARAAMLFLLLAIGGAWSMVSYALELLSTDLNIIRFWVIMQYAANLTIPAVWVLFVQVYTGQEQVLRRRRAAWLFVIPAIHFALALTNDYHHLNWQHIGTRTVDGLVFFDRTYGVIFWVGVLYQQLLLVFSSAVILRATRRASALFRGQVTPLVVAVSFPWIANFLTIFNLNPIPHIDLLPFSLALMCIPLGWSLFRYRLFDLIPAARSKVVESMGDAVFVLDSQDRFIDLNSAAERLMGRRLSDIIGYSVEHLLPGAREMVEQYRGVHEAHLEYTIGPEDRKAYYDLRLSPLYNHQGELTGRVVVMRDITTLKKADQAVRQYATELEARNRELDAFGHTVAHDLKAPLLIILGYTGLLLEDERDRLSPSADEYLKHIQASASRMSEMINNLLVLANLRKVDGTMAEVPIGPIVQAAVEHFRSDIEKRGVSIQVMPDLPAAVAQPTLVEEVFANLINNAIKYIGKDNPAPTVHVRGSRNGDQVRFEVQDNGLGIAPQDQSKLFDMFSRFHPEEASGMGLGLSIVQRIITRLNGEIGVESTPGQGSTFWFTLPAAPGTSEAVAMQRETQ